MGLAVIVVFRFSLATPSRGRRFGVGPSRPASTRASLRFGGPAGRSPGSSGKWQISNSGGSRPIWSRDGKELYFISADSKLMAVEIKSSNATFDPGPPRPLFETRIGGSIDSWFDVSKDGRFLIPIRLDQAASEPMTVVVNWQAGLKK